jgi:hypothetical protein
LIIKEPDGSQHDLAALQKLLNERHVDGLTQRRIEDQIRNIRAGAKGEADAAYQMKLHFGSNLDWVIIHDLRIEHDGLSAQIDHLMINRLLEFWICESKSISQGIAINDHGEFTAFYGSKPVAIPSPIEQNGRHLRILQRLLDSGAVKLPTRLGMTIRPELKSLVLVSTNARVTRPNTKIEGLDGLIKNDQLRTTIKKSLDSVGVFQLTKLIGRSALYEVGRQVVELHRPIQFDWALRFSIADTVPANTRRPSASAANVASSVCENCGAKISLAIVRYCVSNTSRFKGLVYCMPCQSLVEQA